MGPRRHAQVTDPRRTEAFGFQWECIPLLMVFEEELDNYLVLPIILEGVPDDALPQSNPVFLETRQNRIRQKRPGFGW